MEEKLEEHTCEFCGVTSLEVFKALVHKATQLDIDNAVLYICPDCYEERIFEV